MKVKALIDCVGYGYEFKAGETGEIPERLAEKLIDFNYVEEVKNSKVKETKVTE